MIKKTRIIIIILFLFAAGCGGSGSNSGFGIEQQYIALGDSITAGIGDDIEEDDTSQDGKNNGGGFEPILNDLLTAHRLGLSHDIVNEGVGGDTSVDGLAFILTALGLYPDAQKYLLQYGTNDARPWAPVPSGKGLSPGDPGYPGTYKDNMQQIIDEINNAGKEVCLAKIPIALGDSVNSVPYLDPDTGARSLLIKDYNQVIDEFVNDPTNNIIVTPPDFYNYFKNVDPGTGNPRYEDQYTDNLHPNGIGYQSMASLWFDVLTQ
jgi:lysophospholipase L1-like esterase